MIRVLYISYDGMTDSLGHSQVISYLKRFNPEQYQIDIVSFEKAATYQSRKHIIEEEVKNTAITWHPLFYTKTPPVLSTLKDLYAGWKLIGKLIKQGPYDVVHCRGYISAVLGLRIKNTYGFKWIFDMRGWWPDEKKESGHWNRSYYTPVYKYFKGLERKFFLQSSYVVSLTYSGRKEIMSLTGRPENEIGVIPTCVDFNVFKPFDAKVKEATKTELGISLNKKVLVYSGALGGNYSVSDLVDLYRQYKEVHKDTFLLILSKDDPEGIVSQLSEVPAHERKIVSADFKEVYRYLIASDLGVIFYKREFSVIGRSPTKLGEYWACGVPVVSLKGIGDLDAIMEKYPEGGFLVDGFNEESIKDTLKNKFQQTDKEKLRRYAEDYFSIEKGKNFYEGVYQRLKQN